jgi:hypothetical protein
MTTRRRDDEDPRPDPERRDDVVDERDPATAQPAVDEEADELDEAARELDYSTALREAALRRPKTRHEGSAP